MTQIKKGRTLNHQQRQNEDLSSFVFGNVPPQAIQLEEAILGAALIEKDAFPTLVSLAISSQTFYLDAHKWIYSAMKSLYDKSAAVDLFTVTAELRSLGFLESVGGPYYLVELTNKVVSSANMESHALILKQYEVKREMIRMCSELIKKAYDDTVDFSDLTEEAQKQIAEIAGIGSITKEETGDTIADRVLRDFENKLKGIIQGIDSGLTEFDQIIGGFMAGDLGIIAARPGMGKSALLVSMVKYISMILKKRVGVVSIEMVNDQQFWRICSQISGVSVSKMRNPKTMGNGTNGTRDEITKFKEAVETARKLPISYYDGTGNLSVVVSKIRTMAAAGAQVIFIDYVQLMSVAGAGNREQEISTISRTLKSLAKELKIPIIILAQLSRTVESRGGSMRPKLSDLRESGSLEQDADWVTFIHRPEYYGVTEDANGNQLPRGLTELIVAKNRHGSLDTAIVRFISDMVNFVNANEQLEIFDELPF